MQKMRNEDFGNDAMSMIAMLALAGYPYLQCSLGADLKTEIRIGKDSSDGFLREIASDEWTGLFSGVKFRLSSHDTKILVENAFHIAYVDGLSYVGKKNKGILKKYQ